MSYSRIGVVTGANKVPSRSISSTTSNIPRASALQSSANSPFNIPNRLLTTAPFLSTSPHVTRAEEKLP